MAGGGETIREEEEEGWRKEERLGREVKGGGDVDGRSIFSFIR